MGEQTVSVVVPVYNGEQYIADALGSIAGQTCRPMEVIVVDDGSTDGSASVVQALPGITYIYQKNSGTAAARNTGILSSQGALIAFLDQDDRWTKNKLAVQAAYMNSHRELGYTVAAERLIVETGIELPGWLKPELVRRDHIAWLPGTLMVRREVFDIVGLFDTAYSATSDSDWFFRANDLGIAMAALPDVLLEKRVHANNQSYDSAISMDLLRQVRASLKRKTAKGKE